MKYENTYQVHANFLKKSNEVEKAVKSSYQPCGYESF